MDWIARLNQAVTYIEEHLTEKIDYEKLSEIAGCPAYHFQKMFFYMTEMTLSEYIRRRRMSLAAIDLKDKHAKVIDVALKYGYDSPTAFNRAFQSIHGIAPSRVRSEAITLKAYPVICFSLSVHGMEELNFKIETKKEFRIIGKRCPLSHVLEENFSRIPHEWDAALANGTLTQLGAHMNQSPQGLLGVSVHHTEEWKYFIAVSSSDTDATFEEYRIPAATWAVFSGRGTNVSLQNLERRVITEWLPASGYRYAEIPDIEVYLKADPNDAVYEYWLPVIRS
ncbi:AraC family transcriptional regulator [Roseburia hominis]